MAAAAIVSDIQNQLAAKVQFIQAALMLLGLTAVAAREFTENEITTMN